MREILFRGKTDKGEWVEGFYCGKVNKTIFSPAEDSAQIIDKNLYWHEVIPETVGQYTGLTDKNGTKIFEGDVITVDMVHIPKQTGIVEYHKDFFGVKFEGIIATQHCIDYTMRDGQVEIIGNIHDNPELLAGGDCNG